MTEPTDNSLPLIAYRTRNEEPMPLVAASQFREWMDKTRDRFAYRCLPLMIANQAGWFILNTHPVELIWTGKPGLNSLKVNYLKEYSYPRVTSHFGYGIITWSIPYLFRTPPGYNLLARGPANLPKDGITALEGLVETDWSTASFTMNWQITRPNHPIVFEEGEPICMIVPQQRGELEAFTPVIRDLHESPDNYEKYQRWRESRGEFLKNLEHTPGSPWQKGYFRGELPGDSHAPPEHQLKLEIREFTDETRPTKE